MPTSAPQIPIEDLFAYPVMSGAKISPDGTRIAFLAPRNGRRQVWIRSVGPDGQGPLTTDDSVCVTDDRRRGITTFYWTDDPDTLLYQQDTDGNEEWHLYKVNLRDLDAPPVDLTPMAPGSRMLSFRPIKSKPGKAYVQMNWPRVHLVDLHELDIASGELTLVSENPGHVAGWFPTDQGRVVALSIRDDHDHHIVEWDPKAGTERQIATYPGEDYVYGPAPLVPTPDGRGLFMGSYARGNDLRLVRLDIDTGAETTIAEIPGHDLDIASQVLQQGSGLIFDPRTGEVLAARFVGDRQILKATDEQFAEVLGKLEALHDGDLAGVSGDASGERWVVSFAHDTDPGATFFYDHSTGESQLLFRPYPQLDLATLAPMTPVAISARDGLPLPCHLTLPVGVEPSGLPMVLTVHGGPWYRDPWGFDPQVQFFANRGYAVLQVNFRGSIGYGKAHMQGAIKEFAGKMHDDLIDAVEWAVKEGYADPSRVAIYGGSYGGYAALIGATFTPEVFACAIDYVGISDLANFQRTLPAFVRNIAYNTFGRYVGDPDIPEEEADMIARSPISRIDDLVIPLLVVQGANDPRVVKAESDNIVNGLRERGVEVEYMVKDDEGHGFANHENVQDMFRTVEGFLAKHMG